jgi:hypothetical protein
MSYEPIIYWFRLKFRIDWNKVRVKLDKSCNKVKAKVYFFILFTGGERSHFREH